jgi:cold shock CspA family protein
MQATAYTYDPETRSGSVLLDDGTPLPFEAAAFDAGGLRLLRPGQRVRIEVEGESAEKGGAGGQEAARDARRVRLVTLQTF